jgi:dimethylargininase
MSGFAKFRHALVRPPGRTYALGLTTAAMGAPDLSLALEQHAAYCDALRRLGLEVESLPAADEFPDSTFVEDTAVLAPGCTVVTRPGAPSRAGETTATAAALRPRFPDLVHIVAPGTVDGGDICETECCVFIGISERTNQEGARQLEALLQAAGHATRRIEVRGSRLLHLKTGLSALGDGRLLVAPALAGHPELDDFERVEVDPAEEYAANAVRIHDAVLLPAGCPFATSRLQALGLEVIPLEMSEFQKMDGGLSCLSLRY